VAASDEVVADGHERGAIQEQEQDELRNLLGPAHGVLSCEAFISFSPSLFRSRRRPIDNSSEPALPLNE
jgi:hypothetical protein